MKPIFKNSLLALAGITISMTSAKASDDFAEGEIGIAFYQTDAAGAVVQPNTYVVNLGPANLFRENTQSGVAVSAINTTLASSNVGSDLVATFGADWADSGTVRWMVVGVVSSTSATVSGDPARTCYFSRSRPSLTTGQTGAGTTIASISSGNRGAMSTKILEFVVGTNEGIGLVNSNTSSSGINLASTVLPISNSNTVDEKLPPATTGLFFGQSVDPQQTFASGALPGGAGVQGALDIYRILHTVTGADLTAGASTGNAVAGAGQFIGSLTIDSSGNLKIAAVGAPNPDSDGDGLPDTWEVNYFGSTTAQNATGDADNDGTNNLTEFRLGLNPTAGNSAFATVRASNGVLSWPSAVGVSFTVQRSTTLLPGSWGNDVAVPGTAGTATYTDPAPPVGKAFYRVLLQP